MWRISSLLFVGLVAALPVDDADCPRTICVDGLNECGVRWGACYDVCDPSQKPTPPPCSTTSPTVTDITSISPISTITESDCSTETVCWDGINECGQTYGGCFSACTPWPTFTPPPCDITTTTSSSSTSTVDSCSSRTVCADYINECGIPYGGCFPDCSPWPTFTPPPCTTTTTTSSSSTSTVDSCSSRTVCADYINECGMMYGGCFPDCSPWPTFTPPPCPSSTTLAAIEARATTEVGGSSVTSEDCMTQTVCVDYANECGMMYGSCFPNCKPWPSVTPPPCPSSSSSSSSSTSSVCNTSILRCEDYVNPCGQWYGGCFPDCEPYPTFTAPSCPSDFHPSVTETISPSTTYITVDDTATATATSGDDDDDEEECPYLCVDYLNDCGQGYGGCFEACPGEPWPEFEDPGCPESTTSS